ncbi:MAG: ABC transporter ATP-binding protein, partial [Lachnospiraceae bacterium]|nr:ABC transporter ATP-binding protein [Lachnospiraceae bacterium]
LKPRILFADEPTSALDAGVQRQAAEEMQLVRETFGTAVVLISHNIGVVGAMADRVLIMKDGEAVECGETRQVLEHPREAYTRKLMAAVPHLRRA